MKKIWILLIGLLAVLHLEAKENKDTNVAYQDGNVRFTVIDEGVIRLASAQSTHPDDKLRSSYRFPQRDT